MTLKSKIADLQKAIALLKEAQVLSNTALGEETLSAQMIEFDIDAIIYDIEITIG